jgi:hypothetical protein
VAVNQWTQWNTNSERTVTDMSPLGRVTDGDQAMATGAGTATTPLQHASDAVVYVCFVYGNALGTPVDYVVTAIYGVAAADKFIGSTVPGGSAV